MEQEAAGSRSIDSGTVAVVYGIVTDAGGHVSVETAPGAGTTFTVLFPAQPPAAGGAAAAPTV